jgi:hypothetical protein
VSQTTGSEPSFLPKTNRKHQYLGERKILETRECRCGMEAKDRIIQELDRVPHQHYRKILEYIRSLALNSAVSDTAPLYASESSLRKDWLRPEEDEAWADL